MKKFWCCTICGDLHWGDRPPDLCPTCGYPADKHVEITKAEFLKAIKS